jgi:CHAT domain-containing protein
MSDLARQEWDRLSSFRNELARLFLTKPETLSTDTYRARLTTLQRQIEKTERRLAGESALVAAELTQRTVTAAAAAKALPQTGVLVEFVKIRDYDFTKTAFRPVSRYIAFVLTAANEVTLIDLGEASALEKQIGQVLENLRVAQLYGHRPSITQSLASLNGLSTTLWAPLTAALGQAEQVLLSPDGLLNLVPFAALPDGEGHFLLERYRLAYVTSGRELVGTADATRQPATELLLVANPAYDTALRVASDSGDVLRSRDFQRHFRPLPGTEREAEQIPLLVSGPDTRKQVVTGVSATEGIVKRTPSPRILHLATHAFFLDDRELLLEAPLGGATLVAEPTATSGTTSPFLSMRYENPLIRAGLALAGANHAADTTTGDDGILTALEITGMDLQATELVVLSACETAVGMVHTGEGVFGLRRAFALAGAKNLLMSLWPVDDQVTADQMKAFYQNLRKLPPADALRQAQLETISRLKEEWGGAANPGLWAPFILQGADAFGPSHYIADGK